MKYYIQKYINFLNPPIDNNFTIPKELVPLVIPFGSRIFGGYSARSDVDLIIQAKNIPDCKRILSSMGVAYRITVSSYWGIPKKIKFSYKKFNFEVSICTDYTYPTLKITIPLVTHFFQIHPNVGDKATRIRVFEAFRRLVSGHKTALLSKEEEQFIHSYYPELLI